MSNLYKIFIGFNVDYGNAALITSQCKYVYKSEQIQMNTLRFSLKLSQGRSNDAVRKCANTSTIEDANYWYKNSVIKNPDIQEFVRTNLACLDMPLAYIIAHIISVDHCETDSYS